MYLDLGSKDLNGEDGIMIFKGKKREKETHTKLDNPKFSAKRRP